MCVWLGRQSRAKIRGSSVFFLGPPKFNSSKMERKWGEKRGVDGIIYYGHVFRFFFFFLIRYIYIYIYYFKLSTGDIRVNLYNLYFLSLQFSILLTKHIRKKTKSFLFSHFSIPFPFSVLLLFHPSNQTDPKSHPLRSFKSKSYIFKSNSI